MITIKTKLKDYQTPHLEIMRRKRRVVLAEKPGRGKTLTTLAAFADICNRKDSEGRSVVDIAFVMAPRSAYEKKVWEKECKAHTDIQSIDLERVSALIKNNQSLDRLLRKKGLLIYAKHSHLKSEFELIKRIFQSGLKIYFVLDEVHAFRNPESELTMRLRAILATNPMAVVGLSATLLSKGLEDSYHLLSLIKPGCLGDLAFFTDTFCRVEEQVIGRSQFGLRKIKKIVGFKNAELFNQYVKDYLLTGESTHTPKYQFHRYDLTKPELEIYRKIADGLAHRQIEGEPDSEWLKNTLKTSVTTDKYLAPLDEYSSRFIYMQYAADGIISPLGEFSDDISSKIASLITVTDSIVKKGQSMLIYINYYESLKIVTSVLGKRYRDKVTIVESSGRNVLKEGIVTQHTVKLKPTIILATKAGSESESYFFMNNVVFFHTPTVPDTVSQFVGRITRLNTLFPNDLNVHFVTSANIDMYKLVLISSKSRQIELLSGLDENLPKGFRSRYSIKELKKRLLWAL